MNRIVNGEPSIDGIGTHLTVSTMDFIAHQIISPNPNQNSDVVHLLLNRKDPYTSEKFELKFTRYLYQGQSLFKNSPTPSLSCHQVTAPIARLNQNVALEFSCTTVKYYLADRLDEINPIGELSLNQTISNQTKSQTFITTHGRLIIAGF